MKSGRKAFFGDRSGATATVFAVVFPAILGISALSFDYATLLRYESRLREATETSALSAAKEFTLSNASEALVKKISEQYLYSNARELLDNPQIEVVADKEKGSVKVTVSQRWQPFFAHFLSPKVTPVVVSATARIRGAGNICVVGLASSGKNVVHLDNNSHLVGNNCGVYSNSKDPDGFVADKQAQMTAKFACSAGGINQDTTAKLAPTPVTDCPPIKDPLEKRKPVEASGCQFVSYVIHNQDVSLTPGTYCDGLTISGDSRVRLGSGVYHLLGGKLLVTDNATLEGANISIHLKKDASFQFNRATTINLTAPKSGPMAGILVFEDRSNKMGLVHRITSDNARQLLGTIYLPNGTLLVDAGAPVADQSAYTAIVARALQLKSGPVLTLNSNYHDTDIPVPSSLLGGRVQLSN